MKKLLFILSLIISIGGFAQTDSADVNIALDESQIDFSDNNPYVVLERHLYGTTGNRDMAVFRNIDYNFAAGKLQGYIQENLGMALAKEYTMTKTQIIENYISRVSTKKEYLKVVYNIEYHKDIIGYYSSEEVFIIKSMLITGDANHIVNLFLSYWPRKVNIDQSKTGVIASKQFLGDRVSLIRDAKGLKITIDKGNMEVNYETTFGINKKK